MKSHKPAVAISLLIIGLGVAWLLNAMRFVPAVDWLLVGLLGISGILLLTLNRLDRFIFVVGTTLVLSSVVAVLWQTGVLLPNIAAPLLFIAVGVLILLAHLLRIPSSKSPVAKVESPK